MRYKGTEIRYEHDCDHCKPLGMFRDFDLYYCPQGGLPTVIARYGEDGNYTSGLDAADRHPELAEARARSVTAGYIAAVPDNAGSNGAKHPTRTPG